jgi:hypothetical protein
VGLAALLENLPGVGWLAVGRPSDSVRGIAGELARLARVYLKPGGRFAVRAETEDANVKPSDLSGAGTSAVLDAVKGSRVSEEAPTTVFRVALDRKGGVAAVEIGRGPGGAAMGRRVARCLVSGGRHSAVLAWTAMLSGYSVQLVHAEAGEESMMAVARLYAELSHRVDPGRLSLLVLRGGGTASMMSQWASGARGPVFAGFHAECHGEKKIAKNIESPLYLLPEEEFNRIFSGLRVKPVDAKEGWDNRGAKATRMLTYGGTRADVSAVMDGLTGRRTRLS